MGQKISFWVYAKTVIEIYLKHKVDTLTLVTDEGRIRLR